MKRSEKVLKMKDKATAGTQPFICTPLVGVNIDQVLAELVHILPKKPDVIEWRADYFELLADPQEVIRTASEIRKLAGETPILFTIRSHKEGGQHIPVNEKEKISLLADVCRSGQVDLIDYELNSEKEDIDYLRQVSRESGIGMVISYHNFQATPKREQIVEKFTLAEAYGADIAKVAVFSNTVEDVLELLGATQEAKSAIGIPVITMSMGEAGAITRITGWFFGSVLTFAIGNESSAPGQIPIEDLRPLIQLLQKAMGKS